MTSDSRETQQWIKAHPGKVLRHYEEMICVVSLPPSHEDKALIRERLAEGVRQTYMGSNSLVVADLVEQCMLGPLRVYETGEGYAERSLGVVLHQ